MVQLNYKKYGAIGHPIVIVHGLLGTLDNWQTQSKKYAEAGFTVYAVDQRNHGKSPHSNMFDYEVMAQDVHDFMDQRDIGSAHLLGHSMGGKTAMQFALSYPQLVDRLIVVDVAPRAYPNTHDEILDAMVSLNLQELATRQEADAGLATRIPEYTLRQFILKNLSRTDSGELRWKANIAVIRNHYAEIAADVTAERSFEHPTLFIKGENSSYINTDDTHRIKQLFPNAEIITIKQTGHWVHADKPIEFGDAVLNFLLTE